jgi:hypothetical protein
MLKEETWQKTKLDVTLYTAQHQIKYGKVLFHFFKAQIQIF